MLNENNSGVDFMYLIPHRQSYMLLCFLNYAYNNISYQELFN